MSETKITPELIAQLRELAQVTVLRRMESGDVLSEYCTGFYIGGDYRVNRAMCKRLVTAEMVAVNHKGNGYVEYGLTDRARTYLKEHPDV